MSSNSSGAHPSQSSSGGAGWAVIFDMDGVLTDTTRLHFESWLALSRELGLPFAESDYDEMRGLAREQSLARFLGAAASRFTADEQRRIIERKQALFLETAGRLSAADVFPGVRRLIGELRAMGVPLAVGSSSRNADLVLRRIELHDAFDALVDGNDVPISKPDPAIFIECARRLILQPANCVVVEDAASGVDAARRAGMRVIGVGPRERLGAADEVVANVEAIRVDALITLMMSR